jgi:hypothetical protein
MAIMKFIGKTCITEEAARLHSSDNWGFARFEDTDTDKWRYFYKGAEVPFHETMVIESNIQAINYGEGVK